MSLLVFNAGSSTLKFSLFAEADLQERISGEVDWKRPGSASLSTRINGIDSVRPVVITDYASATGHIVSLLSEHCLLGEVTACGHRVVHGGVKLTRSVMIDDDVKSAIADLAALAPLHNPYALETIRAAEQSLPNVPHIACFDTAFFTSLPPAAFIYPLPYSWYTDHGIRRFGFHGLSHAYCTQRASEMLTRTDSRLVICHLGNGCSATAVNGGKPIATSMGFTPMEGLMMGTRAGSIDSGILLHALRHGIADIESLDRVLNKESGLLGVSGVSSDMREVSAAAETGNDRARLALTMFADRVRSMIGALAVTMGGVDALVFTAGIGEHSAWMRADVCRGLECLGLRLDAEKNQVAKADCDIGADESRGQILVIHTREEYWIAREIQGLQCPA